VASINRHGLLAARLRSSPGRRAASARRSRFATRWRARRSSSPPAPRTTAITCCRAASTPSSSASGRGRRSVPVPLRPRGEAGARGPHPGDGGHVRPRRHPRQQRGRDVLHAGARFPREALQADVGGAGLRAVSPQPAGAARHARAPVRLDPQHLVARRAPPAPGSDGGEGGGGTVYGMCKAALERFSTGSRPKRAAQASA